jgi:acetyl esterase
MRVAEITGHAAHLDSYEVYEKIDLTIPRESAGDLPVRIYIPEGAADAAGQVPVILYFHGGGFIMGSIEDHDPLCGKLADASGAIVIAAEYRLAPEYPFPACIEDAVFLAEWARDNAAAYGGDPDRIMAAGDSSGATISAVLALLGRDGKAPVISGLILLYGVFGCISLEESESARLYGQGEYILPADAIRKMMDLYIPAGTDPNDTRLYPGKASDLSGMPPSVIVTAEFDPLRDDGECFARRLKESGCNTELIRMDGMMHGFALYWQRFSRAGEMLDQIGSIVKSWTASTESVKS